MKIEIIRCLQDNYSYLIIDETNLNACVVDPSEAKPIIDVIESNKINLKYILNTHHHFDRPFQKILEVSRALPLDSACHPCPHPFS